MIKSFACCSALLMVLLGHSSSQSAELLLRELATQSGSIVRLGDVADISAATSTELRSLTSTPLLPAPAPGTQQFLSAAQIRDLLVARGIRIDQLTIGGARVVNIGTATNQNKLDDKPETPKLSRQEIELRVQQLIVQYLQENTSADRWRVEISLNQGEITKLHTLGANLTVLGMQKIRSGRQRFSLRSKENRNEVLVSVTLTKIQSVLVARSRIERGELLRATDVEIRELEGNLPSGTVGDLENVVGKVALRTFRPEQMILKTQLRASWQVRRGEAVSVFVRTGGILVRSRAVARENGAMGDLITVELLEDKKRLNASVSGQGEVTIYATGGRATDYASLNRGERRHR